MRFRTIAEFLEEQEEQLVEFLDGDERQAGQLISEFNEFIFDSETADDYLRELDGDRDE